MEPPSQRDRFILEVLPDLQSAVNKIAGMQVGVFPRPSLPGTSSSPTADFAISMRMPINSSARACKAGCSVS
jgi:multidrug efflux pump